MKRRIDRLPNVFNNYIGGYSRQGISKLTLPDLRVRYCSCFFIPSFIFGKEFLRALVLSVTLIGETEIVVNIRVDVSDLG